MTTKRSQTASDRSYDRDTAVQQAKELGWTDQDIFERLPFVTAQERAESLALVEKLKAEGRILDAIFEDKRTMPRRPGVPPRFT